jgi:hypothetical protein
VRRILCLVLLGCSGQTGVRAGFDLDADFSSTAGYFAFPQPSDLRLDAAGHPSVDGLPDHGLALVVATKQHVKERLRHSLLSVAYFQFEAPLAPRAETDVVTDGTILLLDLETDAAIPVVARTLTKDRFVPEHVLAVAARPGFVLAPARRYAFVVRRGALDAEGERLGVPDALATLADGGTPSGPRGAAAKLLYAPLWETLDALDVPRDDVAAATVFTTGSPVEETAALGEKVLARHQVTLAGLTAVDDTHADVCELRGTVSYPQLQRGVPPFDSDGLFELDADGVPIVQRLETAPFTLVLPKTLMPDGGYPLVLYVHGSGGTSTGLLSPPGDDGPRLGQGPAHVHGRLGVASASSAMPLNPERLPDASEIAYLNPRNIPAFRDTFRQGMFEQQLLLSALLALEIDPALLAGCPGPTLPASQTAFSFDPAHVGLQGQSMGGYYTNLVGAIDPRVRVVVPTGAGGYLTHFLLSVTSAQSSVAGLAALIGPALFGLLPSQLSFLHPVVSPVELMLEWAEPIVYVPRLARDPLPGHPARSIYEPVAPGDSYFNERTYDAMALAYGNRQAGSEAWPSMQAALALDEREGLAAFPVEGNLVSANGQPYTGVVVQFTPDGDFDPHAIYQYMDDVKHQFGCFVATAFAGAARAPAFDAPCD